MLEEDVGGAFDCGDAFDDGELIIECIKWYFKNNELQKEKHSTRKLFQISKFKSQILRFILKMESIAFRLYCDFSESHK